MIITKPSLLKYPGLIIFLVLSSVSLLGSCEKFGKKPEVEIVSSAIQDGSLHVSAEVIRGAKKIDEVGFCWGKSSLPLADIYNGINTIGSNLTNKKFSKAIPEAYFESYTGYYIRPFARAGSDMIYGKEIYFGSIQSAKVTPECTPVNNYISTGLSNPAPHIFSTVEVFHGPLSEYRIRASSYSNLDRLNFEFKRKPKTGIYKTSSYASNDNTKVEVIINSGSTSRNLEPGYSIYINEVKKDKFEITMCDVPWKFSASTTLKLTSKIVVD